MSKLNKNKIENMLKKVKNPKIKRRKFKIIWFAGLLIGFFLLSLGLVLPQISALSSLNNGLSSYWSFDSSSGTNAIDNFRGKYNFTVFNSTGWITGILGNSYTGNNSEVINTTFRDDLEGRNNFTINLWIKRTGDWNGSLTIIGKDYTPVNGDYKFAIVDGTNQLQWDVRDGVNDAFVNTPDVISLNTWQMVTLMLNVTHASIYINGTLVKNFTRSGFSANNYYPTIFGLKNGADPLQIMKNISLDEMGFWNRTLNNSEISNLYNNGIGHNFLNDLTVTLNSPSDNYLTILTNITFNCSSNQLVNFTLSIDGTQNYSLNNSINLYTSQILSIANHTWTCYSINENETKVATSRNINITQYIENSITYDKNTTSGNYENFILNITTSKNLSAVNLNYNGTLYSANNINNLGGGNYIITNNFNVPKVTSQQNKSFYWIITLDNVNYSSASNNQTINPFQLDDCTSYTNLLLNYTLYDEDTQIILSNSNNLTTQVSLTLYDLNYNNIIANFSLNSSSNNTKVCIGTISGGGYYMDVITQYDGGANYVTKFNHIQKSLVNSTNIPVVVPLYDLLTTRSQEFLVTFKNSNFLPQSGVIVDVTRQYISEGVFKTVEVAKTDTAGQTLVHLVLSSETYTIYFKLNGVILATLSNVLAKCNNIATGDCQINVNAFSGNINNVDFHYKNGLSVYQVFNETTRTIKASFTTNDSSPKLVVLNVTKFDRFGNTSVCSDSLLSSSGTLSCVVPTSFGNATIVSSIYADGLFVQSNTYTIGKNTSVYNESGSVTILAIMIIITLSMLFINDIRGILLGAFLGILLSGLLIFINSGNLFSTASAIGYALIWGAVILYKINSKEERG